MTRAYHRPTATVPGSMEAQCAKVLRTMKARQSQARGVNGQAAVASRMIAMGFLCISTIETGMRQRAGRFVHAARVEGDLRAVLPGGRAVLVEAKCRPDTLSLSDFEKHQTDALSRHYFAGGLALIGWFREPDVFLLEWPVYCLVNGHPLTRELAAEVALRRLPVSP